MTVSNSCGLYFLAETINLSITHPKGSLLFLHRRCKIRKEIVLIQGNLATVDNFLCTKVKQIITPGEA
jgi:hypothetical protein